MIINSQIHLLMVLVPAMMKAIGFHVPDWYRPLYMQSLQNRIRRGMHYDDAAVLLYKESGKYDLQESYTIARMTSTLWSIVKQVDLSEHRYDH